MARAISAVLWDPGSLASGRFERSLVAPLAFSRRWNEVIGHPFEWTYTGKVLTA